MIRKIFPMICVLLAAHLAQANDSAVETAAGGLRLRNEHSVLMEKEHLTIRSNGVAVEYEFRNTTDKLVNSEVAFPIPEFEYKFEDSGGPRDFSDFRAWVDGKPIPVSKEIRSFARGREITRTLKAAG